MREGERGKGKKKIRPVMRDCKLKASLNYVVFWEPKCSTFWLLYYYSLICDDDFPSYHRVFFLFSLKVYIMFCFYFLIYTICRRFCFWYNIFRKKKLWKNKQILNLNFVRVFLVKVYRKATWDYINKNNITIMGSLVGKFVQFFLLIPNLFGILSTTYL